MKRHHLAIILFALASCKTGPSQPGLTGEPASGGASTQQGEENLMATSSFQYDLATGAASSFQTLASQGWSDQLMARYFYTDQGSMLMPYDLFVSLETEDGGTLFASYDNMSRYGFLAPTSLTTRDLAGKLVNPDKLPIGFTKHIQANNRNLYNQGAREWVGVTCAACHTQRVQFTTASGPVSYLINGGAAVNNHIIFMWELKRALLATLHDQKRLVSLASRISARGTRTNATAVKVRITDFVGADGNKNFGARVNRSVPTNLNGLDREEARRRINHLLGTGRLDAFGNIFNEVNEKIVAGTLPHVPDAPVRYPHLWDSPVTDYVQTNAVTHAPLVRNIGEVLGVYGDFWSPTGPGNLSSKLISVFDATLGQLLNQDIIPFGSSVNFGAPDGKGDGIVWCEKVLRLLKAPAWADIPALPPINVPLATLGKAVYHEAGCDGCHAVPGPQSATSRAWTAPNTKRAPLPSGKGSTPIPNQYQKVSLVAVDALTKNNRKFENTNRPCVAACKGRDEIRDHDVYTINFRGAPIDVTIYDAASVLSGPIGTDERFLANEIQHTLTLNPGDLWQNGLLTAIKADPFASTLIGADGKTIPSYASVGVAALQLTNGYWQSQGAQVSASNALNFSQKPQLYGQYLDAMNSGTAIAPPPMVPPLGYRARNLAGIWATAPYLHNASVPNLRQLLTPPAQRIKQFYIGSLVFDPQNVGFTYANPGNQTDTITLLDTSTPGSSNTGHAYGTDLTDDQKTQLIEYLKTLTSDGEYPTLGG